jgi:hypothetical protein
MARPKGIPKTGGRTKGTKNVKTSQWEELGAKIIGEGAERFMRVLDSLEDEDFTRNYLQILEYFKPKQQRTEHTGETGISITWKESKDYTPGDNANIA